VVRSEETFEASEDSLRNPANGTPHLGGARQTVLDRRHREISLSVTQYKLLPRSYDRNRGLAAPLVDAADGWGTNMLKLPGEKPRLQSEELQGLIAHHKIDRNSWPVVIVGIRGYYKDAMGAPGVNDRGIYDDALFINSPQATVSFHGNTDPSKYRKGQGTGKGKGMALLNPGAYFAHQFGRHKGKYQALIQTGGEVTVSRDGDNAQDTGYHGINIHKGGRNETLSEGCQTIHPDQWDSFMALAKDQVCRYFGDKWCKTIVPYVLLDGTRAT
jgi:hypothetical protein